MATSSPARPSAPPPGAVRRPEGPAATGKRLLQDLPLTFAPASYDPLAGECDVIWSTGAAVRRYDWWADEVYLEVLDLVGADLTRLNAGAALLTDHENEVDALVGSVVPGSARVEAGIGMARIRFDRSSPEGQAVEAKVAGGHLRFVSIGYSITSWEKVETEGQPTVWTARAWQPFEISVVAVPADAGAGMRSVPTEAAPTTTESTRTAPAAPNQEAAMAETPNPTGGQTAPVPAIPEAVRAMPASIGELEALATRAALGAEWVLGQLRASVTLDAARDAAIDAAAATRAKPVGPAVQVTQDESVNRRAGMESWLLHRTAPAAHKLEGPALEFRGATMLDMARASLEAAGARTRGMTGPEIARAAMNLKGSRAGGTASDFPLLLANVQSKRLLTSYGMLARTFQAWARRRDLPDFKATQAVEVGAAPALAAIGQQGDISYGMMSENGEQWSLGRYAKNVSLSYAAIVNDDLGAFAQIPQAFATSAANLENTTVYGILPANAAMNDGTALFAAGHANTGSGALSVDNFATIRTLVMRQTDPTGQQIMVMPDILLVPTELEAKALALFQPGVVATVQSTTGDAVNPYRGTVQVVSTPFLTDATDWFVTVSAGSGYEAVEYGYETGASGPQLTSYTSEDYDGLVFSCRHSFGAKAVTYRTIARSAN